MINNEDVSVVVQGSVNPVFTAKTLSSVRKYLPGAEIILSTWKDCNVSGLDYDKLIVSEDPGKIVMSPTEVNNVKRQICSTINGIKASQRQYILKIRSDVKLTSKGFINYFSKFPNCKKEMQVFKQKIVVSTFVTRDSLDWECSYCLSDWVSFGLKEDMEKLWDIPYPSQEEEQWFNIHCRDLNTIIKYPTLICRYNPEQHILISCMKKYLNVNFPQSMFSSSVEANVDFLKILANNFICLSPSQYGIYFQKETRKGADRWKILTFNRWLKYYNKYAEGNIKRGWIDWQRLKLLPNCAASLTRLNKQKLIRYSYNSNSLMDVIVPCHGRINLLKQTLESLALQSVKNFRVILCDDSDKEEERLETQQLCKEYLDAGKIVYEYCFTKSNLGQVENTNQGLLKATAKYVRILHSDDVLHPQAIEYELHQFDRDPNICCLYHYLISFKDSNLPIFYNKKVKSNYESYEDLIDNFLYCATSVPSGMAFVREPVLTKVGVMDSSFKRACDWDYFYRIVRFAHINNLKILKVSPKYVGYREHQHNNTNNPKMAFINFFEYEKVANNILDDLKSMDFNRVKISDFKHKSAHYRYYRMLRELKSLPETQKNDFKEIIWKIVSKSDDIHVL